MAQEKYRLPRVLSLVKSINFSTMVTDSRVDLRNCLDVSVDKWIIVQKASISQ